MSAMCVPNRLKRLPFEHGVRAGQGSLDAGRTPIPSVNAVRHSESRRRRPETQRERRSDRLCRALLHFREADATDALT